MKINLILLLTSLFILEGCQNAPVRRHEALAEHPEWDSGLTQIIQEGYLTIGMDRDQVKAVWGRPCWSCPGTTSGDWGETWQYTTQTVFFDKNGKVTRWMAN